MSRSRQSWPRMCAMVTRECLDFADHPHQVLAVVYGDRDDFRRFLAFFIGSNLSSANMNASFPCQTARVRAYVVTAGHPPALIIPPTAPAIMTCAPCFEPKASKR